MNRNRKNNGKRKVNFTLNNHIGELITRHDYEIDPTEKLVFDFKKEAEIISSQMAAMQIFGQPKALEDFWDWCNKQNFKNVTMEDELGNLTKVWEIPNAFVEKYYGEKPLWKTEYSQGVVIREKNDDDYYIIVECSYLNKGYKYTRLLVTPGGCF